MAVVLHMPESGTVSKIAEKVDVFLLFYSFSEKSVNQIRSDVDIPPVFDSCVCRHSDMDVGKLVLSAACSSKS